MQLRSMLTSSLQFDKAASQTFSSQLKNKCTSKAKLQTYRLCDEVGFKLGMGVCEN